MRWLLSLLGISVLLLVAAQAQPETLHVWHGVMYVEDEPITLAWDAVDGAEHYEVRALWLDQDPQMQIDLGTTQSTNMTGIMPRTGHFAVQVRACNSAEKSAWTDSRDPSVTKIGKPFRVYFAVPAPDKDSISVE